MFGAVMAVIMKSIGSFSAVAAGIIIVLSGFEVAKGVHQDPGVFHSMLVLFSIVPGLVSLIGFGLLARFKLTPQRVAEMKEELAVQRARRAAEQQSAQEQPGV
jgi:Na+/melibiose symporter-like transporter